jgi:hypothetical protein
MSATSISVIKNVARIPVCVLFAWLPSDALSQVVEAQDNGNAHELNQSEVEVTTHQARERIMRLEAELMMFKRSLGMDRQNKKILLPNQGLYVQADIGLQQRECADGYGIGNLMFDPGLYGGG